MSKENKKYNPDEIDNLSNIAPELSKIKKKNPFRVPKDYFDKLPMTIQNKVIKTKQISVWERIVILFRKPKYSVSFAVVVAALIMALTILIKPVVVEEDYLSAITVEDIINDYPEFFYSMDESQILEVLFVDNSFDIEEYFDTNIESDSSITEDDIIDFLTEEDFNTELIYNF